MNDTKERLARALEDEGLDDMARDALTGLYDDYESPLAFPKIALVRNLLSRDKQELASRVTIGEFDNTNSEARAAWAQHMRSKR